MCHCTDNSAISDTYALRAKQFVACPVMLSSFNRTTTMASMSWFDASARSVRKAPDLPLQRTHAAQESHGVVRSSDAQTAGSQPWKLSSRRPNADHGGRL